MNTKQDFQASAAICKILHNIWYQEPTEEYLKNLSNNDWLKLWPDIFGDPSKGISLIEASIKKNTASELKQDLDRLYYGPGDNLAYPWGTTYTDNYELLWGYGEQKFRDFCTKNGFKLTLDGSQPYDHFGLVIAVLSFVFEKSELYNDSKIVEECLKEHILPWGYKFLHAVRDNSNTEYYKGFSILTEILLSYWEKKLSIE